MNIKPDDKLNDFLEDSKVRLATLIFVVVFFVSMITGLGVFIYKESSWRTNIQRDVLETRAAVEEIKRIVEVNTGDRFTYSQMKAWVIRFKELNETETIKIPALQTRAPNP